MVCKFSKKIVLFVVVMCSLSARLNAMHSEKKTIGGEGTTGKTSYCMTVKNYSVSFLKGWGPTAAMALGATWYTIQKDRQAPMKAVEWAKNLFVETDARIKYPALLLGTCLAYTYYKPRLESLYTYLYNKVQTLRTSK